MGYRCNLGATRACRFIDGFLETEGPNPHRFSTSVKITTEWQTNMYIGPRVYFLIINDGDVYLGLCDGNITVCTFEGELKALHSWEAPQVAVRAVVGYYRNRGVTQEAIIDWDEPQLIHLSSTRETFVLKDGLSALEVDIANGDSDVALSNSLANLYTKDMGLSVMTEGGELVDEQESGYWRSDKDVSTVPTLQLR